MAKISGRRHVVKDFSRARAWIEDSPPSKSLRVAVVSPGPPGIGKSYCAVDSHLRYGGRLVEPSHSQAKERHQEARVMIKTKAGLDKRTTKHIQGLGRRCLYLAEDEWSAAGWDYGRVVCDGCDKRQECPGMRQFWTIPDATFGVHAMADWDRPNALVIDEMPEPVNTISWDVDDIFRLCHSGWHPTVEFWRKAIAADLETVGNAICDQAYSVVRPPPWGATMPLSGLKKPAVVAALGRINSYFETHPMPAPDPFDVRRGSVRPHQWPAGDWDAFFRALDYEIHGRSIPARGRPETACVRVYGTERGAVVQVTLEYRIRWSPPPESHVILDSLAGASEFVYKQLYSGWDVKRLIRDVYPTSPGIELRNYNTHGFSRSRSLTPIGSLKCSGTNARIRALRELMYHAARTNSNGRTRPVIGIVDHKAALEDMGFDFSVDAVLSIGTHSKRTHSATDPLLESTLRELERRCDLVVGYHGGVAGSNKFVGCRVLGVLGDPYGHIGMLQEEARTLGVDAQQYTDWRTHCAAIQEVYRARLLDATDAAPKTVLYFGKKAPPLGPHLSWTPCTWAEGGRIPSALSHRLRLGAWSMIGRGRALFGALSDAVVGLHATLIGDPLLELREAHVIVEEMSPAERETYRRAVLAVAREAGWKRFERPNPLGDRRPMVFWAPQAEIVDAVITRMRRERSMQPQWKVDLAKKTAPGRDVLETKHETLVARVEDVRERVKALKDKRREVPRPDLGDVEGMAARTKLMAGIQRDLKDTLQDWRAVRDEWKTGSASEFLEEMLKRSGLGVAYTTSGD